MQSRFDPPIPFPPTNRDPRTDPRPGDRFKNGGVSRMFVGEYSDKIRYCPITDHWDWKNPINDIQTTRKAWSRWAKNAEVLHAAS